MMPKRVLIVDDNYDVLESCQLMLTDEGHNAVRASNGSDAITIYKEFKPDIVFMDIQMPGIDGYEAFMRIKKHDRDARVVFTSSYVIDDYRYTTAKKRSLVGILNKPILQKDLDGMIKKHAK